MNENQIAKIIVDAAFKVHVQLGPGLFESVYETVLSHELTKRELAFERQKPIPISYDGLKFDQGFKADIVVENLVIVELKSIENVAPVHKKQLLTYLRLADAKHLYQSVVRLKKFSSYYLRAFASLRDWT